MSKYEQFLQEISVIGIAISDAAKDGKINDSDWQVRRDRLQLISSLIREISDTCGRAEHEVKINTPPHCDIRIRLENRPTRCRPGLIEGMTLYESGWLSLAAKDGHVLEIRILDNECCPEAAGRFTRACSLSPDEYLSNAILSQLTSDKELTK